MLPDKLTFLAIGDIVGRIGRDVLQSRLTSLREEYAVDVVIANLENAAGGFGITPKIYNQLAALPIDLFSSGNHIYDKKESLDKFGQFDRLVRPINYGGDAPGVGVRTIEMNGTLIALINVIGQVFMKPVDNPFKAMDDALADVEADIIVVDMHAESTSEKMAMGWHLASRVSMVFGTHTHVQTADEQILEAHTGYITDLGMTGPSQSIIGMDKNLALQRFLSPVWPKLDVPKTLLGQLNGLVFDVDPSSGRVLQLQRIFEQVVVH